MCSRQPGPAGPALRQAPILRSGLIYIIPFDVQHTRWHPISHAARTGGSDRAFLRTEPPTLEKEKKKGVNFDKKK